MEKSDILNLKSEMTWVLTLDIGTSSLRAMLFDAAAQPTGAEVQIRYEMHTTADGGVEADPDEMFEHACHAMDQILAAAGPDAQSIKAVGSDSLVGNILGVDAAGRAVTPVYTYADTRAAREVTELRARFDERAVHQRVGTFFHTSYLPARFLWLARAHPDLLARSRWWMSLGEYFLFRWLGRRVCSFSVASWTGLLNRQELAWDRELVAALPISVEQLSPLSDFDTPLHGLVPEFAGRWPVLNSAAFFPTVGDGAAANLGSGCVNPTQIALTVGTSSAMRVVLPGPTSPHSPNPLSPPLLGEGRGGKGVGGEVPTEGGERGLGVRGEVPPGLWAYRVDKNDELIGGALNEGGSLYAWMESTLRLDDATKTEAELEALAPDAHGLTVLPFLAGERAPGWVSDARADILGLSLNTRPIEILRAGLEAVAYRLDLVFELLRTVAPNAHEVIASGGALMHSPVWTQIIADVLGAPVIASGEPEATSRGIALLALKGLGVINRMEDLPARLGVSFLPDAGRHEIYTQAVKRQQKWYNLLIKEKPTT